MIKVLFVCHGNICRSAMAKFMFKDMVKKNNIAHEFEIDSCGTSDEEAGNENLDVINSSYDLNAKILDTAAIKGIEVKQGRLHTTEAFYSNNKDFSKFVEIGCKAVEMEAYALFYNAKKAMKKATALITISDSFVTHELIDSSARETKLDEMILLALESIIKM